MKAYPWIAYAIALCLLIISIVQTLEIQRESSAHVAAQKQLQAVVSTLRQLEQSNALLNLHLFALDAKDPGYLNSRVFVAWDSTQHRGAIGLFDFPLTPAGHDYQLWVLDPNAASPVSAGVISAARTFEVGTVSTAKPGFAVSLEPAGGSTSLTGPILFAVAPAE